MSRRYLYLLLFAIPALLVSLIAAGAAVAAAAAVLWLFVFGDDPWPRQSDVILAAVALLAGGPVLGGALTLAFRVGTAQESQPRLSRRHLGFAIGLAVGLGVLIALQLAGPRRGPVSDSERCADLCRAAGFDASAMAPRNTGLRTCSCLDGAGTAVRTIELTN